MTASLRPQGDQLAMLLSRLCLLHCVLPPLLLSLLPWLAWLSWVEEQESTIHLAMLVLVLPLSLWALRRGHQHHRQFRPLGLGLFGLGLLMLAAALEFSEQQWSLWLTVLGSLLLGGSHWLNLRHARHCPAIRHQP